MKIHNLPAKQGMTWIKRSVALMKREPIRLIGLIGLFLLTSILPGLIPLIGGLVPLALSPILGLGVCTVMRQTDLQKTPTIADLFEPFRLGSSKVQKLLILGLINLFGLLLILTLTTLIDDGLLMKLVRGQIQMNDPALKSGVINSSMLLFIGLFVPFVAALWYAPQFIAWHNTGVVQSIFYSCIAVWRNKGAFAMLALGWLLIGWIILFSMGIAASAFMALAGTTGAGIVGLIQVPLSFLFIALGYGAIWYSYADILVEDSHATDLSSPNDAPPPTL